MIDAAGHPAAGAPHQAVQTLFIQISVLWAHADVAALGTIDAVPVERTLNDRAKW